MQRRLPAGIEPPRSRRNVQIRRNGEIRLQLVWKLTSRVFSFKKPLIFAPIIAKNVHSRAKIPLDFRAFCRRFVCFQQPSGFERKNVLLFMISPGRASGWEAFVVRRQAFIASIVYTPCLDLSRDKVSQREVSTARICSADI